MDGIVLINKPPGCTSYDIVRKLKRFPEISKIGHGGTLDPAAGGLLVILTGEGCKISRIFLKARKSYKAAVKLGAFSSTGDATGILERKGETDFSPEEVRKAVSGFKGEYRHRVPSYSSKKYKGKTFYKIKRSGKAPPEREQISYIYEIEFEGLRGSEIFFRAAVSSGTYIRTLAEDIASRLGTWGYLHSLTRTSVGKFKLDMSVPPVEDRWKDGFIPLQEGMQLFPHIIVDRAAAEKLNHGISFSPLNIIKSEGDISRGVFGVFSPQKELKALACKNDAGAYELKRVLKVAD